MRQIPTPSFDDVLNALREGADTDVIIIEIGDASTGSALYACGRGQIRGYAGRGRGTARGMDLDVDAEDNTSPIHQGALVVVWTAAPLVDAERHGDTSLIHQYVYGQPCRRSMWKGTEID